MVLLESAPDVADGLVGTVEDACDGVQVWVSACFLGGQDCELDGGDCVFLESFGHDLASLLANICILGFVPTYSACSSEVVIEGDSEYEPGGIRRFDVRAPTQNMNDDVWGRKLCGSIFNNKDKISISPTTSRALALQLRSRKQY